VIGFSQYSSKESDTPKYPDRKEGARLLVGRYCMLDEKNQMRVDSFSSNGMVRLSRVPDFDPLPGPVSLQRIKQIERYGVSVYDLKNLPVDLQTSTFEWTLEVDVENDD
jgi:hypothetical protein